MQDNNDSGGTSPSPPPTIAITISPTSATVSAGGSSQFQASVSGSSDTAVQWQVNKVSGGNSQAGTISSSGLYTAPATAVSLQVTVTAIAAADPTETANAAVTVYAVIAGSQNFSQQCCWALTTQAYWSPDASKWSILEGSATVTVGNGPNGSTVANLNITGPGSLTAAYQLPQISDLRGYDTLSFVDTISTTGSGGLVTLVDSSSHRRWYSLVLTSTGWRQPVYSLTNFVGQDSGFDLSQVEAIRFNQTGLVVGDLISIGAISFDVGLVDHADYSSNWVQDPTCGGTLSTSTDAAVGTGSVLANVAACGTGQAGVAINGVYSEITWDWSTKTNISFYYKDSNTAVSHYFLIYDKNHYYRKWLFSNNYPGQWMKITAPLTTDYYLQSGSVDLSNIIQFEVGISNAQPYQNYAFQIDEVTLYPTTN